MSLVVRRWEPSRNRLMAVVHDRELIIPRAELHFDSRTDHIMSMPALHPRRWTIDEVERIVWQPPGSTTAFELDVKRFFEAISNDSPLPEA